MSAWVSVYVCICLYSSVWAKGFFVGGVLKWSNSSNGQIGLLGMEERLKLLGGWLKIEFYPGQGTLLVAHIPLKETT